MLGGSVRDKALRRQKLTRRWWSKIPVSRNAFCQEEDDKTSSTAAHSTCNHSWVETSPEADCSCCACHRRRMQCFSLANPCVSRGCSSHVILAGTKTTLRPRRLHSPNKLSWMWHLATSMMSTGLLVCKKGPSNCMSNVMTARIVSCEFQAEACLHKRMGPGTDPAMAARTDLVNFAGLPRMICGSRFCSSGSGVMNPRRVTWPRSCHVSRASHPKVRPAGRLCRMRMQPFCPE